MLVLSRKPDESILIGNQIIVTAGSISPQRVKLVIEAPRHLSIVRAELAHEQTDADDFAQISSGMWFQSASSDVWHRSATPMDRVSAIMLNGARFVREPLMSAVNVPADSHPSGECRHAH